MHPHLILDAAQAACETTAMALHTANDWSHRGHDVTVATWQSVLLHDTVTPASWSRSQLTRLLRDGHSRLPGPIANVQLTPSSSRPYNNPRQSQHDWYPKLPPQCEPRRVS